MCLQKVQCLSNLGKKGRQAVVARVVEHIDTKLSRDRAFGYIADFANQAEWDPNTVSSTRIDEGELGVGARFSLDAKAGPRVVSLEYRITRFEPPSRVELVGEGSGVHSEDRISFVETPEGTRIEYDAELTLGGVLALLGPLLPPYLSGLGKGIREGMARELDALAAADPDA